jgi:hypothetical protein
MSFVDPKIADIVAHLPGVHFGVLIERNRLANIADGIFATHDHPGGHEITVSDHAVDGFVNLDGPAPLSVEFGHWTKDHKTRVEGLHILSRAVAAAQV